MQIPAPIIAALLAASIGGIGSVLRRLDCPAFLRALETGQTKRLEVNLNGYALNSRS